MNKRFLAFLLVIGMIAAIIAGCSTKETTTTGGTTTKATTTATTATTATTKSGPQATAPGQLPVTTEPVTLTLGLTQNVRVSDYETNFMTKMVKDECGIELDFVLFPTEQPEQKIALMISGGEKLPDIINFNFTDPQRAAYGRDGVFKPLNDYMDNLTYWYKMADVQDQSEYDDIKRYGTSPDGNFYGFPAYVAGLGDTIQYQMNINHKWLDNLSLDMPTTTDEFYTVLKAFKDGDPNKNNKKDEIPFLTSKDMFGASNWFELINTFVYFDPYYPTSYFSVTDGKLWAPFITEEYRNGIRYVRKLVSEGLMSELSFSMTPEEEKATVNIPPEQDSIVGVIGGVFVLLWDGGNENIMEYDALPALKGPTGVSWIPQRTPQYLYSTFITKDNPYPEISFRMFDYWWDEKRSLTQRFGEPGVHWEYAKDDPAGFLKKYPYLSSDSLALGLQVAKHIRIPGVDNPWTTSKPQNSIWGLHFCCGLPRRTYNGTASPTPVVTTWNQATLEKLGPYAQWDWIDMNYYGLRHGKEPAETAKRLLFTTEEDTAINELRTTINSYINESIALFAVGTMNIETDWDAYVKSIQDMGLQQYLETSQTAYDRMYK